MKYSPFFILLILTAAAAFPPNLCFAQGEKRTSTRRIVSRVAPIYPQVARTMKLSGTVKLEVLVQPGGSVKSLQVKGGSPLLAQSAQNAIRSWKWEKADRETTEQVEFLFAP